MTKSFASFFNERYFTQDHAYRRFRLFREMARPFHIHKQPVVFDQHDIKYLYQFPRKFWLQAMLARYSKDLFAALKERHNRRSHLYKEKYDEILPGLIDQWKQRDPKNGEKLAKRQAALDAEEYSASHKDGGVEFPEEKTYTFKPAGKGRAVSVKAKTYMKQLVQKLEGDHGDPNGFDLAHPRISKDGMATRGFNFPNRDTIREMLSEWLNYISHHMLGQLPDEGEDIRWRPDQTGGSGKTKFDDTFTVNRVKEERYKYWHERIPTEENVLRLWQQVLPDKKPGANSEEIRNNNSKREQLARALAERDVKKMAADGKIRTPPTPHHPEGRTVGLGDDGEIQHPSLYMPHKKVQIRYVDEDGQEEKTTEEVPFLLPGNFLRKLTPYEAENLPDEAKVGKHWNADSGRHEAQYIPVTDHPAPGAQGTDHLRAGALNPNNNTTGRKFLDPSHPEYNERLERLNHEIGLRNDGQSDEIYSAIEQALGASNVGGMGNHERQVLMLMKRDLHNLAYMMLMENLDESESKIFRLEWRKRKIRDLVAKYGQQDWGRGTRRLRGSKSTDSLDREMPSDVDDEDTMTLADKLGKQLDKAKAQALALKDSGKCKVAPGGKRLNTGECQFEYDLRQLHIMLDAASEEAAEADSDIQKGEDAIDGSTMGNGVQGKLDATFRAFTVLKAQYENMGESESGAEEKAMAALKVITQDDPPAQKIISRVRYKVDKLAQSAGSERAKMQPINKNADVAQDQSQVIAAATNLSQVEETLQGLLDAGEVEKYLARVNNPHFATAMSQLMQRYPSLKPRYERLIQQASDVKHQIAQKPAKLADTPQARQAANAANKMDLKQMVDADRYDLIPFNAQFRRLVGEGRITLVKVKDMLAHLKQRQGGLFAHPGDQEAIAAFEELIGGR